MHTKKEIKDYLGTLISEAMYMEEGELQEDELFSDFGLESTTLVKILVKVSEKYSCTLTVNELLSHQTLQEASDFIYDKINKIHS